MVQHGWTAHAKMRCGLSKRGNRTSLPSMGVPTLRALAVALLLATLASSAGFAERGTSAASRPPNIVFILADDFSWNLVRFMPRVKRMQKDGVSLARYYVTDSLCCPSRASIFTGKFPHNTGIFTNGGRAGGWPLFHSRGLENDTFATRLQAAGYSTAFMGKYMNGYAPSRFVDGEPAYVPPGWDTWVGAGDAYTNYNYVLNEDGTLVSYGGGPEDYLTDVLARKGSEFIESAALADRKPFLLELSTFTPHAPFTPAPRHARDFPNLRAPRTPAFDESDISDKPTWLAGHKTLRARQLSSIDSGFRRRAQSVEAIDELLATLQETLRRTKQLSNTYIFFTSDNGYHMGEHRLANGKQTAFETDIRVPLIVTGPGVPHGTSVSALASNIDLYPTFVRIGGGVVPTTIDGHSLGALLRGTAVRGWRKAILVEHHGPDRSRSDPDYQTVYAGNPMSYEAIRTQDGAYVEYVNGELEYYDMVKDPYQLSNAASRLTEPSRAQLHSRISALAACAGQAQCWTAADTHPPPPIWRSWLFDDWRAGPQT